jgi:putative endonuclease
MWYVYILKSKKKDWRYTGYTNNLKDRFKSHNQEETQSTKHYAPFELEAYVAVNSKKKAKKLEKYFKTGSGKAILLKRILQSPKPGLRSPSAVS